MSLLIGQALDGRQMEEETRGWTGDQFANLCDSLVWAASRRTRPSAPPSFSPITNAPDGGVDAECEVSIETSPCAEAGMMIGSGWNVFQYKKRDATASGRKRIVSGLKSMLKGGLADIQSRHGRRPDRYILCVNINLGHNEKKALNETLLDGFDRPTAFPDPIVLGAQELAQLLNDNPHLRAAYFHSEGYRTWKAARAVLDSKKFQGIVGQHSDFLKRRKAEVKRISEDPSTAVPLKRRLQEWLDRVDKYIDHHAVRESDDDIDGLMRHVHDKGSSQRIWAIGRILNSAPLEEVRKLLSAEAISEALPQVELSQERRRMLESVIPGQGSPTSSRAQDNTSRE